MTATMKRFSVLPHTGLGIWSVGLIVAMPLLIGLSSWLMGALYADVPAGGSTPADILARPALALSAVAGMAAGIAAFFSGLAAIVRRHERSLLVYAAALVGGLLMVFLIGELFGPPH